MSAANSRGKRWDRIAKIVLNREPLCRHCLRLGRYTVAEEVDHIIPISKGGTNEWDNLQPLCEQCHKQKTRQDIYDLPPKGACQHGTPLSQECRLCKEFIAQVEPMTVVLPFTPFSETPIDESPES